MEPHVADVSWANGYEVAPRFIPTSSAARPSLLVAHLLHFLGSLLEHRPGSRTLRGAALRQRRGARVRLTWWTASCTWNADAAMRRRRRPSYGCVGRRGRERRTDAVAGWRWADADCRVAEEAAEWRRRWAGDAVGRRRLWEACGGDDPLAPPPPPAPSSPPPPAPSPVAVRRLGGERVARSCRTTNASVSTKRRGW
eukprot:COSAG01_NODE_2045_length_8561_cov_6.449421_7_plen_197_part_00